MIARLLIHPTLESRLEAINNVLTATELKKAHPDVLWITEDEKLGVEAAKKIRQHLSLKPYSAKGRAVVVEKMDEMTLDAQNSLLKTLEEPPVEAIILLGATSEKNILPTVLSRVQTTVVERGKGKGERGKENETSPLTLNPSPFAIDIERLLTSSIEQRFEYIEKLEDKEAFFQALLQFFHTKIREKGEYAQFSKELFTAEGWIESNGNIRAALEYLMLILPR